MRPIPRIPLRQRGNLAVPTSQTQDLPAPIGGLNTRDSLSIMPPTDAVRLVNWVPQATGLTARNGSAVVTDAYTSALETIIPYVDGTNKTLLTFSDGNIYTDDGEGTRSSSLESSLGNDRWFAAKISNNMVLVNGADAPRNYDGSTITTPTISGDLATYGEDNIDGITKFKSRLFMWDSSYGNFFYGGVNSVSGSFAEFQLDRVSNTGGNILEIKSISRDAGDGADDYAAFILDTGEVLIYQGSDPSDANNWALVGKFFAPPLIAKGCALEYSGDILMVTQQDVIKLSDVIKYGSETGGFNIQPSKLSGAISSDWALYGGNYGWQIAAYPSKGWVIINVPTVSGTTYHQYVINTVTGAATRFEGWNAYQFAYLEGKLYFGFDELYQADTGLDDSGAEISLIGLTAYSNLGLAKRKRVTNVRLYLYTEGQVDINLSIGYDYDLPSQQGTQISISDGAEWDDAEWDVADWAGLSSRVINFVTSGLGQFVGVQVALGILGQGLTWHSITYNYDVAQTF